jgi:hypothetical protein
MQNKPKVKLAKFNVSSFVTSKYVQVGQLVIQTNKAKTNPIQSQFQRPKMQQQRRKQHYHIIGDEQKICYNSNRCSEYLEHFFDKYAVSEGPINRHEKPGQEALN